MVAGPIETVAKQMMRFAEETNPFLAAMRAGVGNEARSGMAARYRAALKAVEEKGDYEWMLGLFADDAVLHSPAVDGEVRGAAGVRQVFEAHRAPFDTVATTFGSATEAPGVVTMPWTLRGTAGGQTIDLSGMTVLEVAGDKVKKLTAYYDASKIPAARTA
jgi:ketosteroid isomerase-like protein